MNGDAEMYRVNKDDDTVPDTGTNVLRGDDSRKITKDCRALSCTMHDVCPVAYTKKSLRQYTATCAQSKLS